MRINWKEEICGHSIRSIRDMLRRMGDHSFCAEDVAQNLRVTLAKAKSIVRRLVQRGWLELVPKNELSDVRRRKRTQFFERTIAGNSLAMARAMKRISRREASARLKALVKRAKAINADEEFGWYVKEVHLFGSYLDSSAADIGDIDLAIVLKPRPIIGRNLVEHGLKRAEASEKILRSYLQKITYAEREVRLRLKNRDPYISIHDTFDLDELKPKSKLIYRAPIKDSVPRAARQPTPEK